MTSYIPVDKDGNPTFRTLYSIGADPATAVHIDKIWKGWVLDEITYLDRRTGEYVTVPTDSLTNQKDQNNEPQDR